jgi:outer membrane receptor protein involved in Fe transport
MYDPTTGQPVLWSWNAASSTWGLFAEDTWKAAKNLTLTLGLRWDDSGNPYSRSATTVFGNFYFGPGATFQDQVTNGFAKAMQHALNHAVTDLLSPRIGFAWDPTGKGNWALRGGYGLYNNWLTQANVQEEFRGDPPGPITPTFYAGGTSTADLRFFPSVPLTSRPSGSLILL